MNAQFVEVSTQFQIFVLHESTVWGNGASFYDFNHDGWDDLTTADGSDFIRLFENDGEGNLSPSEHQINFTFSGQIIGVLWFDYDNDDDEDLLVSQTGGRLLLFNNDGNLNFTEVGMATGLSSVAFNYYGVAAADCNYDGYLDFAAAKYYNPITSNNQVFNSSYYKNNGNGTFTEVTFTNGLAVGVMPNFMPVFFDINHDDIIDLLYVVDRYQHPNKVFINDGNGNFTDQTSNFGFGIGFDAMSGTVGDYDNDSDFDLFMSNTVPGNYFFENNDGVYTDIAASAGVQSFQVCWGSNWIDYNNDGLQDLFVGATNAGFNGTPNFWYINNGDGTFTSNPTLFGATVDMNPTFCNVIGDVNNDGYYDYYNNNNDPTPSKFWKNLGGENNYLSVSFKGTVSNKNAFGTKVFAYANGQVYSRYTHGGESYIGQNSNKEIFGLGTIETIDSLIIRWPLGLVEKYYDLPVNQHIQFIEGASFQNNFSLSVSDITICPGQSATIDGGDGESWLWNTGHNERYLTVDEPGEYFVTVGHGFGFSSVSAMTIVQNQEPPLPYFQLIEPLCFGNQNGQIIATYDYPENVTTIWDGEIFNDTLVQIGAGEYHYVAISENGCLSNGMVQLNAPDPIEFVYATSNVSCFGANDGAFDLLSIFGGTGLIHVSINANELNALSAGQYTVTFEDVNGCSTFTTFEITEPSPLNVDLSVVSGELQGQNGAFWNIEGGTQPYVLSVNDQIIEPSSFTTLGAGDYLWTISDANGCQDSGFFSIEEVIPTRIIEWNETSSYYSSLTREFIFAQPTSASLYSLDGRLIQSFNNTNKIQMPDCAGIWLVQFGNVTVRVVTN